MEGLQPPSPIQLGGWPRNPNGGEAADPRLWGVSLPADVSLSQKPYITGNLIRNDLKIHSESPLRLEPIGDAEADAAVAIVVRPTSRGLEILLVRRAINPSDPWSGDIAFPGGRRKRGESPRETALREVLEEVGINLNECEALGTLKIARSRRSPNLRVLPIVYLCRKRLKIRLGEELSQHFWIPLERLRRSRDHALIEGHEEPAFLLEEGVVWGLTYRMLEDLLSRLKGSA